MRAILRPSSILESLPFAPPLSLRGAHSTPALADLDLFIGGGDPTSAARNELWFNDGSGNFNDGTGAGATSSPSALLPSGMTSIGDPGAAHSASEPSVRAKGAAAADIDGDGDIDLFVSDQLWLNDGNSPPTFTQKAGTPFAAAITAGTQ